jgi:hypothetical protein
VLQVAGELINTDLLELVQFGDVIISVPST